ncbi:MAG: translation initiation factor IF-6 [Halobacteriales archaeon]
MLRTEFNGSPFVGVFASATENALFAASEVDAEPLADELGVDGVYSGTVGGSSVLGSLVEGNSSGVVVSASARDGEVESMEETTGARVVRLDERTNAVGNLVLANDDAALVSPGLDAEAHETVADALGVEVRAGTVGGVEVVGSAAVATNSGVLAHPRSSDDELGALEDLFGVNVDVGTVNYGTPLVGSGLLANTKGYVAGSETTGPELGRIEETLGFV